MDHIETAFVLSMILFPALFTLFVRNKQVGRGGPDERTRDLAAKQRRLWIWTAAAVFAYAGLESNGVETAAYMLWVVCFPLWFLLAIPVLQAKDPGWRGVPRPSVRTAALVRRDVLPAGLKRAWIMLAVIWGSALFAAVAGLFVGAPGADLWWLVGFPLIGGVEIPLFYWGSSRSLIEPEPHVERETTEIRSAREGLRSLKLYGWLGLAAACVLVFSAPALILIWAGQSALMAAIAIGAGSGALVGIGGGVFGTMADLRRAKLNRLCLEQSTGTSASSVTI